ncbi:hypothetical protein SNOG_07549 [Parastagonospora nodorum SN15]|uniref:Uncharacterized protein n=1 Tax=Phaeosphaeria nodorum (strain SN15 / ATCC MYA-4574 / FGSC 10173) TaxID=321614 RepID=Q0UL15_PHANO|nr:hypothetical protein SNOG_07549 [Parastagonospora nodorum SN15]EAT85015.2 hypothetical protein SNOG_07549 [Parastagonospora nodorum SN15]
MWMFTLLALSRFVVAGPDNSSQAENYAGPTYVIYNKLYGALDKTISKEWAFGKETVTMNTCLAEPTKLKNWEPARTEDWMYFITSYRNNTPTSTATNLPYPLPTALNAPVTTYESTSTHVTVAGCLRCQNTKPPPAATPNVQSFSEQGHNAAPEPTQDVNQHGQTKPNTPQQGDGQGGPNAGDGNSNGGNANGGNSNGGNSNGGNSNGGNSNDGSSNGNNSNDQRPPGNPVVIGGSTFTVRPGQSTPAPDRPGNQNQPPPVVVIGSQTLTQGQSTIINGVPVVVPSDAGGSQVVIGGTSYPVNNGPTAAPVLTVGQSTVTANPEGQFIVGSETLKPGGPALTIDGSTVSLGPGGGIAIINGATQTLANAPVITSPPAITVDGRIIPATVVGGTTQLVIAGQTLVPGGPAITVDGTTYSLPSGTQLLANGIPLTGQTIGSTSVLDGTTAYILGPSATLTPGAALTLSGTTYSMPPGAPSVIIINGMTSTLARTTPAPALTIAGKTYTPATRAGTLEYVLAQGTTLRPGQAVTLGGTTYSLDPADEQCCEGPGEYEREHDGEQECRGFYLEWDWRGCWGEYESSGCGGEDEGSRHVG